MTIKEILNRVDKIEKDVNYWFVRTNYGDYFSSFTKGNYIAIGWDYFTLDEIENNDSEYIKNKIAIQEKFDTSNSRDKAKITTAYHKIKTFLDLKANDIIVVPSKNSDRLAFGKVIDNKAYEEKGEIESGSHFKRRKIEWIETKNIRSLNPIFYEMKFNQHSVSNINRFAPYIDKVMGNLFKKDDNTHYVLNIEKNENINFDELRSLMDNINILVKTINKDLGFNENLDEFYIKINLQSKGTIELIKAGKSLAILAYILSLVSCGKVDSGNDSQIQQLIDKNRKVLEQTKKDIDTLEVNTEELTKPFNNGN